MLVGAFTGVNMTGNPIFGFDLPSEVGRVDPASAVAFLSVQDASNDGTFSYFIYSFTPSRIEFVASTVILPADTVRVVIVS